MIALSTVREWLEIEDNYKKVWREEEGREREGEGGGVRGRGSEREGE